MTPAERKAAAEALRALAAVLETAEGPEHHPLPSDAFEFVETRKSGIPPKTCQRLIKAGVLPAFKVGRTLHVRRADVRAWVESQRVERPPAKPATDAPGPAKAPSDPVERLIASGRLRRVGNGGARG